MPPYCHFDVDGAITNDPGSGTSIETAYYGILIGIKVPRCKAVRPGQSVLPKIRLTESGTDLIDYHFEVFSFV